MNKLISLFAVACLSLSCFAISSKVISNSSKKNMHISFDDVHDVLQNLTDKSATYTSIFDNPFLSKLKDFHVKYGAVFSFYCFTEFQVSAGNIWHIENTTTKFADEFRQNSSWLKFGFHSGNPTLAGNNISDYERFVNSIIAITGGTSNFDLIPRLHAFAGTYDFCMQLKNYTPIGTLGYLTADDTRSNYYLSAVQNTYINANDSLYDSTNKLYFFKSETRLENAGDIDTFLAKYLTASYSSQSNNMIIFTHEYYVYTSSGIITSNGILSKIESCISWAVNNGYNFEYPMNVIPKFSHLTAVEDTKIQDFKITPNPCTSGKVQIFFKDIANSSLTVTDLTGREISFAKNAIDQNTMEIQFKANFSLGIYLVNISTKNGIRSNKLIVR